MINMPLIFIYTIKRNIDIKLHKFYSFGPPIYCLLTLLNLKIRKRKAIIQKYERKKKKSPKSIKTF